MITHATVLSKFLDNIRSPSVVYNTEEEDQFTEGGVGFTNVVQNNMEIFDSKPTSKPYANEDRISGLSRFTLALHL